MKKIFVLAFVAALLVCGVLLSCSNGSNSPLVGVTLVGGGDNGAATTTPSEPTGPTAAENAKIVADAIKALTESSTVKVTGKLDASAIRDINAALKELASRDKNILVTLDLSEVTGLLSLEPALDRYGINVEPQKSFYGCSNLAGVMLPNTLKSVGKYAFCDCTGLKSITIPDSVTYIDWSVCSGCVALEEITLPFLQITNVPYLDEFSYEVTLFGWIFAGRSYEGAVEVKQPYQTHGLGTKYCSFFLPPFLRKVKVSSGKIFPHAFDNCSMITDITIGAGVTEMNHQFIGSVEQPKRINYEGTIEQYCKLGLNSNGWYNSANTKFCIQGQDVKKITDLNIPDDVKKINPYAFYAWKSLTSVIIPGSVTSIGDCAFSGCESLVSVTIPNYVTSIGDSAFSGCESLVSVTIPNYVTSICWHAFGGCVGLKSVTIGNRVKSIHSFAFAGCTGLTSVTIPDSVIEIDERVFSGCTELSSVTIGKGVNYIESFAFYGCSKLTSAIFSDATFWTCCTKKPASTELVIVGDHPKLTDPAIAATCLRDTYCSYHWYKD